MCLGSDIVNQLSYKHVDFGSDRDNKYRHLLPSNYQSAFTTDEREQHSKGAGKEIDAAVYYKETVIPSLANMSKHLMKPVS